MTKQGALMFVSLLFVHAAACPRSAEHLVDPDPDGHLRDTDGDGILDGTDDCPTVADADQLDSDGDGVPDACDPDVDGDGAPNHIDPCPSVASASQSDMDNDGTGDACDIDIDGDGLLNESDPCPETPGGGDQCAAQREYIEPREDEWRRGRGSCPYVYLWDGAQWAYATDLSGSVLGAHVPFFRPAFYGANVYRLDGFRAADGVYRINLREVIQEASFVDDLALLVVDVPEGHDVHTQWSFTSQLEQRPNLEFLTVREPRAPLSAVADDGTDVLAEVSARDGIPLPVREDQLSRVVLDFGPIEHPEHARLVVTAWGFYADFTRFQRPPYSAGTTIETLDEGGQWQVRLVAGKAAGDSKTWIIDISGLVRAGDTRIRLTMAHQPTALDVLDMVRLDSAPPVEFQVTRLRPGVANLGHGGSARVDFSSLKHRIRADNAHEPINPRSLLDGRYTRYGDVRPLLDGQDDRFVIMAHGDQLELEFDAPAPSPGTARHVFLEADLFYSLMHHPLSFLTSTIEPLPFHAMESYPYQPESWPYQSDSNYHEYLETWNTRLIRLPEQLRVGQHRARDQEGGAF
jgi:hypothetical protein